MTNQNKTVAIFPAEAVTQLQWLKNHVELMPNALPEAFKHFTVANFQLQNHELFNSESYRQQWQNALTDLQISVEVFEKLDLKNLTKTIALLKEIGTLVEEGKLDVSFNPKIQ